MKIRRDFVTNSSASSYIICFARIEDRDKAQDTIDKYHLKVYNADGVNEHKNYFGVLGADWCGAEIWSVDNVLSQYPDDEYVIIEERLDAYYDDKCDPIYDYNFDCNKAIDAITKENGFDNKEVSEGEGRDG